MVLFCYLQISCNNWNRSFTTLVVPNLESETYETMPNLFYSVPGAAAAGIS